jgi:K+ transport systems, NAD-binding component
MRIIIVGGGKTGSYIAKLLASENHSIKVIEQKKTAVAKLSCDIDSANIIRGNGSDPTVLEEADILHADVVVAVTGEDEVNLVVSMLAKMEYGVGRVVARVNNPNNSWMFNAGMGVDVGIDQASTLARFVEEGLNPKEISTLMKLARGDNEIIQLEVSSDSQVVGRSVKDLKLPEKSILIAIEKPDGNVLIPNGNTVISGGDEIIALTDSDDRIKIKRTFA